MGHADSKSGVATQFKYARTRLAAVIFARKSVQVVVMLGVGSYEITFTIGHRSDLCETMHVA